MIQRPTFVSILMTGVTLAASLVSSPAHARDKPPLLLAPMVSITPAPKLASVLELKFRVADSTALTTFLLDLGVRADDVVAIADLATNRVGDRSGGSDATIAISRRIADREFRIERITLRTNAEQTIIDRRGEELEVSAQTKVRAGLPRIA